VIRIRGNPALHSLDRYVGIPALALLGALRRPRELPASIGTIGLLKSGAIGDTVLMSAVIADLRSAFPQASLLLFSGENNYEIACMLEGLTRVLEVPVANPLTGLRILRSVSVDVLLDFGPWSRTEALFSLASKAAYTVGFKTPGQYRHYAYDTAVEHSHDMHELENYRRLVKVLGAKTRHVPFLRTPQCDGVPKGDYVACHLWPGGRRKELKRWPMERWATLIERLVGWGFEVTLTGAPAEVADNDSLIRRLSLGTRRRTANAAGVSLKQTAAILARARLVVSVDTGVMHIAAALGAPLVALHGPTSSRRWGPLNDRAIAVDTPLHDGGYMSLGWEDRFPVPACMEAISLQSVVRACDVLLKENLQPASVVVPDESSQATGN